MRHTTRPRVTPEPEKPTKGIFNPRGGPGPKRAAALIDFLDENLVKDIDEMATVYGVSTPAFIRACLYLATIGGHSGVLPTHELFNTD